MSNLVDTLINLQIFLFVALLIWLYFKDFDGDDDSTN